MKGNAFHGIVKEGVVTNEDRSRPLDGEKLAVTHDEYVRISLRLPDEFGLRRKEAGSSSRYADRAGRTVLKAWTKGGQGAVDAGAEGQPVSSETRSLALGVTGAVAGAGVAAPPAPTVDKPALNRAILQRFYTKTGVHHGCPWIPASSPASKPRRRPRISVKPMGRFRRRRGGIRASTHALGSLL